MPPGGGIAPLRLDSFAAVKSNAALIAGVTTAKTMPPFLITHDGTCGDFEDGDTLTEAQIATLAAWASSSLEEGAPASLTPPPVLGLDGGSEYQTPTITPVAQGGQLAEFDEYRCYALDPKLAAAAFITGYEVTPGNPAMVHHLVGFVVDPHKTTASGKTNAQVMDALDAQDADRPGWPCFGLAGDGVEVTGVPITWAPGQGPTQYPSGMGVQLRPADRLVVQVHYNLADPRVRGQTDASKLKVTYAPTAQRRAIFAFWDPLLDSLKSPSPVVLPPSTASTVVHWDATLANWGLSDLPYVDLVGIMPHMHARGHQSKVELVQASGATNCLAQIKQWNFDWQKFYFERAPVRLTGASTLRTTCDFDTSGSTTPVFPGWGTRNEMCLEVMMLALPPGL